MGSAWSAHATPPKIYLPADEEGLRPMASPKFQYFATVHETPALTFSRRHFIIPRVA
jgi:hypothetical protein